jgi:hypothetical protein
MRDRAPRGCEGGRAVASWLSRPVGPLGLGDEPLIHYAR